MDLQHESREAAPRVAEGDRALESTTRGRSTAPLLSLWLPILGKVAAAAVGALILAIIGAKAGAHAPPPTPEPIPSATAPVVAAGFMIGLPAAPVVSDAGSIDPSPPPTSGPLTEPAPPAGAGLLADGRVVLNAASEAELTKLPGIGPSRARAILALRQRMTKFRAVEDLLRIKGIGRKMLRRLRPNVVLDRPSTDPKNVQEPPSVASPPSEDSKQTDS